MACDLLAGRARPLRGYRLGVGADAVARRPARCLGDAPARLASGRPAPPRPWSAPLPLLVPVLRPAVVLEEARLVPAVQRHVRVVLGRGLDLRPPEIHVYLGVFPVP